MYFYLFYKQHIDVFVPPHLFAEKTYHIETSMIQVDFTGGMEIYDKIRKGIKGKEIGILGKLTWYFAFMFCMNY